MKRNFIFVEYDDGYLLEVYPSLLLYPPQTHYLDLTKIKWARIVALLEDMEGGPMPKKHVYDGGGATCAICVIYYKTCHLCPISRTTGALHCHNSPYDDWSLDASLENARAMRDFVYSLPES